MKLYNCDCCNFSTKYKNDYQRHLKTKKHMNNESESGANRVMQPGATSYASCDPIGSNIVHLGRNESTDYVCKYCNSQFTRHQSLYKHMNYRCKKRFTKEERDIIKLRKVIRKEEKNKLLKEFTLTPKNSTSCDTYNNNSNNTTNNIKNTTNNTTNSNSNNNITNNITINNFGCENTNFLTDDFKYRMVKMPYNMMRPLIEAIHLNPKAPENRNIKIENIKDKRFKIYENNMWQYKGLNYITHDIVDSKCYLIDGFYRDKKENNKEEFDKNITYNENKNYEQFQTKYDGGDDKLINTLQKDCKDTLFILRKDLNKNN